MLVDTGVVTCTDVSVCHATCQRLPLGDIVPSPEWTSGSGRGALRTRILAPRRGSMPVGTGLRAVATGPIPVGTLPEAGPPHGRTALPGRPGGDRERGRRPDGCPRAPGSPRPSRATGGATAAAVGARTGAQRPAPRYKSGGHATHDRHLY